MRERSAGLAEMGSQPPHGLSPCPQNCQAKVGGGLGSGSGETGKEASGSCVSGVHVLTVVATSHRQGTAPGSWWDLSPTPGHAT